jgi:hypothetical protein
MRVLLLIMKPERKAIGNSKRFKVFERDGYRCRYCGQKPPEVILHVDHFIPVAKGGGNEMDNLLTSCSQCNQGKKARLSRSPDEGKNMETIIVSKKEVLAQLKKMRSLDEQIQIERDKMMDDVTEYWYVLHNENWPTFRQMISFRTFFKYFSATQIKEAIDLSYSQCGGTNTNEFKYMCGILQNWKKDIMVKPVNRYE